MALLGNKVECIDEVRMDKYAKVGGGDGGGAGGNRGLDQEVDCEAEI